MWWLFNSYKKTKDQLQKEVDKLNEKYKDYLNTYCMHNNRPFFFSRFALNSKNEICIKYIDHTCPKNVIWVTPYGGQKIDELHTNFLKLEDRLERIGLKLVKIEDNE